MQLLTSPLKTAKEQNVMSSKKLSEQVGQVEDFLAELIELRQWHDQVMNMEASGWDKYDNELIYKPTACEEKRSNGLDVVMCAEDLAKAAKLLDDAEQTKQKLNNALEIICRILLNPENMLADTMLRQDAKTLASDLLSPGEYYYDLFKQRSIL